MPRAMGKKPTGLQKVVIVLVVSLVIFIALVYLGDRYLPTYEQSGITTGL